MKKVKDLLVTAGLMSITLGVVLHCSEVQTEQGIFEEIPNGEIQEAQETEYEENGIISADTVETDSNVEDGQGAEEICAGAVNEFTYAEAQLLMRLAQAEAGNQGEDGMWLVMSVVMNRIEDESFPDSVEDVIYQKYQFSSVWDLRIDEVEISADAHEALARIEQGDVAQEIIGFETKESTELDKYFAEAFTYRDHKFYTSGR